MQKAAVRLAPAAFHRVCVTICVIGVHVCVIGISIRANSCNYVLLEQVKLQKRQDAIQKELEQAGEDMDKMGALLDDMAELNKNATDLDLKLLESNIDKMMPELGFTPEDSDQLVAAYRSECRWQCVFSMPATSCHCGEFGIMNEQTRRVARRRHAHPVAQAVLLTIAWMYCMQSSATVHCNQTATASQRQTPGPIAHYRAFASADIGECKVKSACGHRGSSSVD